MKKLFLLVLMSGLVIYTAGCGKKQQPISETQEPISMEELGKLNTQSNQASPEAAAKGAPLTATTPGTNVTVPPIDTKISDVKASEAKLEQLPPSGPYKPSTKEIQSALKNAGYYTGKVDGKKGPQTKKAVEEFQKANSLPTDGRVGPKTWSLLSKYLNQEPAPVATGKKR
jgi:peptidoglycan hydrolase-like protein with peptidoglycan-binding domain